MNNSKVMMLRAGPEWGSDEMFMKHLTLLRNEAIFLI